MIRARILINACNSIREIAFRDQAKEKSKWHVKWVSVISVKSAGLNLCMKRLAPVQMGETIQKFVAESR